MWASRNYFAYDQFVLINQAAGANFWAANNESYNEGGKNAVIPPCGRGYEGNQYCLQFTAQTKTLVDAHLSDRDYIAADEAMSWHAGWEFVRESPGRSVLLSLKKVAEFWGPKPDATSTGAANGGDAKDWISVATYGPVLLLAMIGALLARRQFLHLSPIYAYAAIFTAVYAVYLPTTRYRLPLDFFLIIFAAYGLKCGLDRALTAGSGAGASTHTH
jgi:hypothetical protein